jgi:hypothetical protein
MKRLRDEPVKIRRDFLFYRAMIEARVPEIDRT